MDLPQDLNIEILLNFNLKDLVQYCRTNKQNSKICLSKSFWLLKLKKDFPNELINTNKPLEEYKRLLHFSKLSDPCKEFYKNPLINPYTGLSIKKFGPTYKKLVVECGDPSSIQKISKRDQFLQNPTIDPYTGNTIKETDRRYYQLMEEFGRPSGTACQEFLANPTKNPYTGRTIKINGPKYNQLVEECGTPT